MTEQEIEKIKRDGAKNALSNAFINAASRTESVVRSLKAYDGIEERGNKLRKIDQLFKEMADLREEYLKLEGSTGEGFKL